MCRFWAREGILEFCFEVKTKTDQDLRVFPSSGGVLQLILKLPFLSWPTCLLRIQPWFFHAVLDFQHRPS